MPRKIEITDTSFENSIILTEVLLAHKCTYRAGELCTVYKNGRNFSGFVCPLSGSAVYTTSDGMTMTVSVGEIAYLPEMSRYVVGAGEKGFTHYTVNFRLTADEDDKRSGFSPLFGNMPIKISADNFDAFRNLFSKAIASFGTNMPGSTLLVKAHLYEAMQMFFSQALRSRTSVGEYEILVKAKEYIEQHFTESIRAEELSRYCSMSETNLRRKFREYIGQPPLDYQIGLRIRRARELLLERKYNVSEVAVLVGFDDVNYFSRLFKKRVGISPQGYEKMY